MNGRTEFLPYWLLTMEKQAKRTARKKSKKSAKRAKK